MENYKIIDVLKSFDRKEFKRFGEFVSSPYFNKNINVIKLYDSLEKYYPEFKGKKIFIEKIFVKVFPKEKYDYHKINNVISDLYQLSEKYLSLINFERREFSAERHVIPELRNKSLFKIYEKKSASYIKQLIERKVKDEDYFYYLYEMNDDYLWYATYKEPNTNLNLLQNEFDNFFYFSLMRLLRFYCLMLHERNQNNVQYNLVMLDEVMQFLRNEKLKENPTLLIFKTILLLLYTKDIKYYEELKKLKSKYYNELKYADQNLLYLHLYDFAAYMINFKGDDTYNTDMFEIYKEMIERKMMTPHNFLYPNFMNVVKIACRVKEFDYAEIFMKEFQASIPADEKENVLAFCYGTIENAKGNLEKALSYFSKTNFRNFIFKVQVKILLLKIYFKLGMYEQAFSMIDTFRHYITREKNLLPDHRDSYNQFLRLMSKLIKIKENSNKKGSDFRIKKIKEEADKIPANPFRVKVWLQEEVREL